MRLADKILQLAEQLNIVASALENQKLTASDRAQLRTTLELLFGTINEISYIITHEKNSNTNFVAEAEANES